MGNEQKGFTQVLNVDTNKIVLLPLQNSIVSGYGKVYTLPQSEVLAIDDEHYKEIASVLSLPETQKDFSDQFFETMFHDAHPNAPKMNPDGYKKLHAMLNKGHGESFTGVLKALKNMVLVGDGVPNSVNTQDEI